MTLLLVGILEWIILHWLKYITPNFRAMLDRRMGVGGAKGFVAFGLVLSIVFMVVGYRQLEYVGIYMPIPGMGHLNNLLMLVAVFLLGAGSSKGVVASKIRHPMLWAVVVWAVGHLLVNGDVASIALFGGLGMWALTSMLLINNAKGAWDRPAPGPIQKDIKNAVIALVIYAIIAGIHIWLGKNPFLGTYG